MSRRVAPVFVIHARVTRPASAGIVAPYERSYGSMERPISSDTRGVGRCVIFSPPTTSTVRWRPAATAAYAVKSAAAPDEVAVSARRLGTRESPR